jgi:hypothetical protein
VPKILLHGSVWLSMIMAPKRLLMPCKSTSEVVEVVVMTLKATVHDEWHISLSTSRKGPPGAKAVLPLRSLVTRPQHAKWVL